MAGTEQHDLSQIGNLAENRGYNDEKLAKIRTNSKKFAEIDKNLCFLSVFFWGTSVNNRKYIS
jgi:hypothetical protein